MATGMKGDQPDVRKAVSRGLARKVLAAREGTAIKRPGRPRALAKKKLPAPFPS